MQVIRPNVAATWAAIALTSAALFAAPQLPLEPKHDSGQGITGAFEGWYKKNRKEVLNYELIKKEKHFKKN